MQPELLVVALLLLLFFRLMALGHLKQMQLATDLLLLLIPSGTAPIQRFAAMCARALPSLLQEQLATVCGLTVILFIVDPIRNGSKDLVLVSIISKSC